MNRIQNRLRVTCPATCWPVSTMRGLTRAVLAWGLGPVGRKAQQAVIPSPSH
jgi:hypothetical protein